jgi:hypothetical protein
MRVQGDHIRTHAQSHRAATSENFPMAKKTIAALLILSAFATAGANPALAQDGGFKGGGILDGSGGFHGRGLHKLSPPIVVGGYGYADNNGSGNGSNNGSGNGTGSGTGNGSDWYGISSGHDECPRFRKRVMTPDGWSIQMVPVC